MSKQYKTPIGFFIFNRLDTTSEVFEEIRKVRPEKLYLISDGARENKPGEKEKVEQVRAYVENRIDWPCTVTKNYAPRNMGCKNRMASGITWLLENEEMAVILEDDCKPTQEFFRYTEEVLSRYQDDEKVMMVSGSKLMADYTMDHSYTFSRYAMIWGWATWRRAWSKYDIDIKSWGMEKKKSSLKKYYTWLGYIKATRDFDSVYNHEMDTWDYQWTYTVLENEGLAIIPSVNMIENLGCGREDATHTTNSTNQNFTCGTMVFPLKHPDKVEWDAKYDKAFQQYAWGINAVVRKVISRLGWELLYAFKKRK